MRIRFSIAFLVLYLGAGGAPLLADQIVLKNGDRVTGSIVKKDGAKLTIDSAHFGTISLPWDQIDTLTTDVPAYIQAGGQAQVATLRASAGQMEITPTTGGARTVALADVAAIRSNSEQASYDRLQNPTWLNLWAGTANLGWAGTAGNSKTKTFALGALAARTTLTDKTSVYFNAVTASALVAGATSSTARAVRGGWAYQRDIRTRVFLNVFNDYEYDRFQSLDLRFVLGGGAGYHVIASERTKLDALAGISYDHESFSTPLKRNAAEFYWGDEFTQKLNGTISVFQAYRMFDSLSDTSNFRVNFDLGASAHLAQWLTWNITASDRYLRNPVPGRLRNDVLYSTGLGVTFGRR